MPRPAGGRKDSCFGEAQLRRRQSVTAASLPPGLRGIRRQSAWWPPLVISRVRAVVEPFTSSISQPPASRPMRVGCAKAAIQPPADLDQHGVAGFVAVAGVDAIEVVDADHHIDKSEEHTSELQSLMCISYAVFCLKKKKR